MKGLNTKFEIRLNTGANPKNVIFTDWQLKSIEALSLTDLTPIGSRAVFEHVNRNGLKISRGSINRFLESLYDLGLLLRCDESDGNRKRFAYTMVVDRQYFDQQISTLITSALVMAYPDVRHSYILRLITADLD